MLTGCAWWNPALNASVESQRILPTICQRDASLNGAFSSIQSSTQVSTHQVLLARPKWIGTVAEDWSPKSGVSSLLISNSNSESTWLISWHIIHLQIVHNRRHSKRERERDEVNLIKLNLIFVLSLIGLIRLNVASAYTARCLVKLSRYLLRWYDRSTLTSDF